MQTVEARSIQADDAQKQMKLEKERVKARLSQEWAHSTSQGKEISSLRAELTSTRAAMQEMRDLLQNALDNKDAAERKLFDAEHANRKLSERLGVTRKDFHSLRRKNEELSRSYKHLRDRARVSD